MKLTRQQAAAMGLEVPAKARSAHKDTGMPRGIFVEMARSWGLPEPVPEYRFKPPRQWRFDWAWLSARVAVEIQGGLFSAGRHVRGAALLAEYEKLDEAVIAGWRVLLVTPAQVKSGEVFALVKRAIGGRNP